ncbi:uncharacterized protein LOC132884594 [Neoarius graeffei]|uniref:uncharacterized protein LOC132884594 n=1 Tax=Neoarius graeffei TaxID=443677 RepID=UPI00298CA385|nr:uncharacterized protein LOC132884594 [Neoarius graeffei]
MCEFYKCTVSFLDFVFSPGVIQMDPDKVKAVIEWPVPSSHKELQHFLGFANFYRRFIRNYNAITTPLTELTSSKHPFSWTGYAERAFPFLKSRFTIAPVLIIPDPAIKFILKVDASDTPLGIKAGLSQRSARDNKTKF